MNLDEISSTAGPYYRSSSCSPLWSWPRTARAWTRRRCYAGHSVYIINSASWVSVTRLIRSCVNSWELSWLLAPFNYSCSWPLHETLIKMHIHFSQSRGIYLSWNKRYSQFISFIASGYMLSYIISSSKISLQGKEYGQFRYLCLQEATCTHKLGILRLRQ